MKKRSEGKSTRQIAEEVGVSQKTADRVVRASESTDSVDLPTEVIGKDGKKRKARKTECEQKIVELAQAGLSSKEIGKKVSIAWVHAKLALAAPLDDSKDRIVAAAQAAFTQAITEETGKSPKDWYESVAAKSAEALPEHGGAREQVDIINLNKGGTSADYTRIMQEVSSLVEAEAKAHEEAARLAAEKAEESERSGMAERPTLV
jgi:hypothetical protein